MKRFAMLSLMLAAALSSGCSDKTTIHTPPEAARELLAPGSYTVGFRNLELTYPAVWDGADRTLPVRVWYPAVDGGEPTADYALTGIGSIPTDGALAAPALAEGGPFPLAIYSHGIRGDGVLAYPYGELFASHGWVVVAPSHPGDSLDDRMAGTLEWFALVGLNRPHDITAVLDWLQDGPDNDALAGQTRTDAVFSFGHSYGGYTAFAAGGADQVSELLQQTCGHTPNCAPYGNAEFAALYAMGFGDPRIAAIAPQSPWHVLSFAKGELANLPVPTMMQSARQDFTMVHELNAKPAWDRLDDPGDIWLDLPNAGHLSFISICHDLDISLVQALQSNPEQNGCGPESSPTEELVPILGAYLLGFARQHVLAEERWDAVLRDVAWHPEIVVHTHE